MRKGWFFAAAGGLLVAALLGWAWSDAGLRPLTPQTAPATLPQVAK